MCILQKQQAGCKLVADGVAYGIHQGLDLLYDAPDGTSIGCLGKQSAVQSSMPDKLG